MFDAVYVPDGANVKELVANPEAVHFIAEAFKHCKPIGAEGKGEKLLKAALPDNKKTPEGIVTSGRLEDFVTCVKQHRFFEREVNLTVPA